MIYRSGEILIRDMNEADPAYFTREERLQGWHADESKLKGRLEDVKSGLCVSIVAEYRGEPAGYVNIYKTGTGGPFAESGLPVIVDFNVLEKFRRRGIGTALMDEAEKIALQYADTVWLGVGLHAGYGSAQRMYVKRGYIPDGSGVWYGDKLCEPYADCVNDDDLVLFLSKKLK